MLNPEQKQTVKKILEPLKKEVELVLFTSDDCEHCDTEKELLSELAGLGKVKVTEDTLGSKLAKEMGVESAPMLLFRDEPGVRFAGLPSGHEFRTLLDLTLMVAKGDSGLNPETRKTVAGIKSPVEILVFITPTCPYCPMAVFKAHQFAIENPKFTSTMVEAIEFPELSRKHQVMSVPKVVINGKASFVGAVPETKFLEKIREAL
jgi:glutaredoxin-like protein